MNAFLKALWGYDPNRIWRVEAIQKTMAPNIAKVVVFVSDKSPNAKVQPSAFFVTPDGKHAIAGDAVIPFGATPFADASEDAGGAGGWSDARRERKGFHAGGVCRYAVSALQRGAGHDG